jgi:hypothetical protein
MVGKHRNEMHRFRVQVLQDTPLCCSTEKGEDCVQEGRVNKERSVRREKAKRRKRQMKRVKGKDGKA